MILLLLMNLLEILQLPSTVIGVDGRVLPRVLLRVVSDFTVVREYVTILIRRMAETIVSEKVGNWGIVR